MTHVLDTDNEAAVADPTAPAVEPAAETDAIVLPGCSSPPVSVAEAFAKTAELTHSHYENFTVGSILIPKALRQHVFNLYAFCRGVDDLGDEIGARGAQRLSLLEQWQAQLDACYAAGSEPNHWAFVALRESIRELNLPREPFDKLIEANRRDQRVSRYDMFDDVLEYCDHSANPVGRLFLRIFGYADDRLDQLSDQTCSALQLVNFWQDIERDLRERDRIYVPRDTWARFDITEADFRAATASPAFREMVKFECERACAMFERGWPLLGEVDGRIRTDLELFTRGGLAILRAIKRQDYDTLRRRPTFGKVGKVMLLARLMLRPPWAKRRLPRFPGM